MAAPKHEVVAALVTAFGTAAADKVALSAAEAFVASARGSWPTVEAASAEALIACLRAGGVTDAAGLGSVDAGEVWLAAACANNDPAAVAIFERDYIGKLVPALRSLDLDGSAVDDVKQRVRQRLLTAEPGKSIRLLQYAGKGRLFGLVKVVAIRMTLDDKRRRQRAPDGRSADDRTVDRVMDGDLGPELAVIETQHRSVVKAAFQSAIDSLDAKERGILRLHLLQGSSIDQIAALHDVHRATAARWIVGIREALAVKTRGALRSTLALDEDRLASLLRAVDSRLDLSLSRVLAPSQSTKHPTQEE